MESNQNSTNKLQEIVNRKSKVFSTEKLNYFFPNGQRMTHQMRWFKVCPFRDLVFNTVA